MIEVTRIDATTFTVRLGAELSEELGERAHLSLQAILEGYLMPPDYNDLDDGIPF